MHGVLDGRNDQDFKRKEQSTAIGQDGQVAVRDLPAHEHPLVCTSSGRESAQQCDWQLADFVRLLPSSLALAELHGDQLTAQTLLAVLEASGTQRLLQYPSYAVEEAWRSLAGVERERLWDALGAAGLRRSFQSPLAVNYPARVGRLRAYGNAIVPQVAAEFIRAFLETERTGEDS
jgi:hypothetical protein